VGPAFQREIAVAPRRIGFYVSRTAFVAALFALAIASWQVLVGSQRVVNLGDMAWFGAAMFQIMAPLQLAVAMPFATLLVASSVALEKDRKTLDLLLMTRLSNTELVFGKLLASLLIVFVVLLSAAPLLLILSLLGGVDASQIWRGQAVTLAAALAAGSLGSLFALWREKTFQALAMSTLVLVLWIAGWEIVAAGTLGDLIAGVPSQRLAVVMSPWQAVQQAALPPFIGPDGASPLVDPVALNVLCSLALAGLLNIVAVARVRVWNPKRDAPPSREDAQPAAATLTVASPTPRSVHSAGGKARPVWDNPILWREICTWSFGKKVLIIRAAYLAVFLLCAATLAASAAAPAAAPGGAIPADARPLAALMVVSLILVNALSVTSLTNERDSRALDLLLVTDLSPKEIVFGKLGGAFYNAKEMILLPAALCTYLWFAGRLGLENLLFVLVGWGVMVLFAAMLGLHAGITYANSRTAIATSVGTLLFLFLGIGTCMRIMLAFSSTFEAQFGAFFGFIAGGIIGMYVALNWRYRSMAINLVAGLTPVATFFIITSFLLGHFGTVFLVTVATYGYAVAAMMVPAVSMFDVALGEAAAQEE
jgi:ABC-type transport system involved in multi-copper enzyme maturation permease subunit